MRHTPSYGSGHLDGRTRITAATEALRANSSYNNDLYNIHQLVDTVHNLQIAVAQLTEYVAAHEVLMLSDRIKQEGPQP